MFQHVAVSGNAKVQSMPNSCLTWNITVQSQGSSRRTTEMAIRTALYCELCPRRRYRRCRCLVIVVAIPKHHHGRTLSVNLYILPVLILLHAPATGANTRTNQFPTILENSSMESDVCMKHCESIFHFVFT